MSRTLNKNTANQPKTNPKDIQICPECGGKEFVTDNQRGEVICRNCGTVIEDFIIDDSPEWRAYSSEERAARSRVGAPTTFTIHDKGLSTSIGLEDRDALGKKLTAQQRNQYARLRKWNTRSRIHSSTDRNLTKAMRELDRLASQLFLPRSVKETASVIYRNALKANLIRGRSIEEMVAASIYAAARQRHLPRTLDEISQHTRISKKELGRAYRLLISELNMKIPLAEIDNYIARFSSELQLSGIVANEAKEIIRKAKKTKITMGKDPVSLAAAAIYIAGILHQQQLTQQEIAAVVSVTEVTIRNRYKELVRKLDLVPQSM